MLSNLRACLERADCDYSCAEQACICLFASVPVLNRSRSAGPVGAWNQTDETACFTAEQALCHLSGRVARSFMSFNFLFDACSSGLQSKKGSTACMAADFSQGKTTAWQLVKWHKCDMYRRCTGGMHTTCGAAGHVTLTSRVK